MSARSLRQDFLSALGRSAGVYLFGTLLAFLVGVQLARGLGVAGYGLYGSAMAAASLGSTFASGGLQLHATRDLAAYCARGEHEGAARLVGWSLHHALTLGAAAAVAAGCYVWWGLEGAPSLVAATMAATVAMALLVLIGAILRGVGGLVLGQALDAAIRPAVLSALLFGAVLAFGRLAPGTAMTLTVAAVLLVMPFGWRTLVRVWRVPNSGAASAAERSSWARASATMGLSTIFNAAEASLPLILVGALTDIEQAGLFRVALAVTVFVNLPTTILSFLASPMASQLHERGDRTGLARLALAGAGATLLPTLGIAACIWLFGETLLALAFGSDYRAAAPIMSVMAGASVAGSMAGISISLLYAGRQDAVVTRVFAVSLAVTCAGLGIAAIDGRAIAIAGAVLAAMAARMLFLTISTRRLIGIDPTILAIFRAPAAQ